MAHNNNILSCSPFDLEDSLAFDELIDHLVPVRLDFLLVDLVIQLGLDIAHLLHECSHVVNKGVNIFSDGQGLLIVLMIKLATEYLYHIKIKQKLVCKMTF